MFRTEIQVPHVNLNLSLQDKIITIGSCFAEVIGSKLQDSKVEVLSNPFGTIFNPISVCLLLKAASGKPYDFEKHLLEQDGIWHAYDLHSSLSSTTKEGLLNQIQERLHHTNKVLHDASLLIITLGTAIAYKLNSTGEVVANCHKLPAKNFARVLISPDEAKLAFEDMYGLLKLINPKLKVLLTVSPVRHIKETLLMNSVSKATLRLLCHHLQEAHEDILYFPAFEIMMDDLRDYRFYKQDMIHPTETAEDYIWQKFIETYYNRSFQQFITEWDKIKKALAHKPFHPNSNTHQAFLQATLDKLQLIKDNYKIDVTPESQLIQKQLQIS